MLRSALHDNTSLSLIATESLYASGAANISDRFATMIDKRSTERRYVPNRVPPTAKEMTVQRGVP